MTESTMVARIYRNVMARLDNNYDYGQTSRICKEHSSGQGYRNYYYGQDIDDLQELLLWPHYRIYRNPILVKLQGEHESFSAQVAQHIQQILL